MGWLDQSWLINNVSVVPGSTIVKESLKCSVQASVSVQTLADSDTKATLELILAMVEESP